MTRSCPPDILTRWADKLQDLYSIVNFFLLCQPCLFSLQTIEKQNLIRQPLFVGEQNKTYQNLSNHQHDVYLTDISKDKVGLNIFYLKRIELCDS